MVLPYLTRPVQRQGRIGHLLHALIAHLGEPEFNGLGLGAGDELHQAQKGRGLGAIGGALFAVRGS